MTFSSDDLDRRLGMGDDFDFDFGEDYEEDERLGTAWQLLFECAQYVPADLLARINTFLSEIESE